MPGPSSRDRRTLGDPPLAAYLCQLTGIVQPSKKYSMKNGKALPKPARWYAPDKKAEARLLALGAPRRSIYRAHEGETVGKFRMRRGEYLGIVDGLRAFGGKRGIDKAVAIIHGDGATIIDIETGKDSRSNGISMYKEALSPRRQSEEYKKVMRDERMDKRRKANGQMLKRDAYVVWMTPGMSTEEKEAATGWPRATLYAMFGKTGAPAGRRPSQ